MLVNLNLLVCSPRFYVLTLYNYFVMSATHLICIGIREREREREGGREIERKKERGAVRELGTV